MSRATPRVSISLSSASSFLPPSSAHPPPPPPSPPGSRKDTPAFMPHYHRFETRQGGSMSFFIALLLAARFAEPARRRASQKLRHDSTKSRRRCSFSVCRYKTAGRQPSSFLHKKLSLNLKAGWVLPPLECLVNVRFFERYNWPRSEEFRLKHN